MQQKTSPINLRVSWQCPVHFKIPVCCFVVLPVDLQCQRTDKAENCLYFLLSGHGPNVLQMSVSLGVVSDYLMSMSFQRKCLYMAAWVVWHIVLLAKTQSVASEQVLYH